MKKWQITLILITIALVLIGMYHIGYYAEHPAPEQPTYYSMTTIVVAVDHNLDRVTVKDYSGSLWQFNGAEDWQEGDIYFCVMDDNTTPIKYDDKITNVTYCGNFEIFEKNA